MHAHMSKTYKIAVLAGDGIGPEVMAAALNVLRAMEKKFSIVFDFNEQPVGGVAIDTKEKRSRKKRCGRVRRRTPSCLDLSVARNGNHFLPPNSRSARPSCHFESTLVSLQTCGLRSVWPSLCTHRLFIPESSKVDSTFSACAS